MKKYIKPAVEIQKLDIENSILTTSSAKTIAISQDAYEDGYEDL